MKFICRCGQPFEQFKEFIQHYELVHKSQPLDVVDICPTCGRSTIDLIGEPKRIGE
jgi:hypothetical protein